MDWNTFLAFTRTKGIITLTLLVVAFLLPFRYDENGCSVTGQGFPAPLYTKTMTNCPAMPDSIRNFYGFNIPALLFNVILFYLIACLALFLHERYGKKH